MISATKSRVKKVSATTLKKSDRCNKFGPWTSVPELYGWIYANVMGVMSTACQQRMVEYVPFPGCAQHDAEFEPCANTVFSTIGLQCPAGKEAECQELESDFGMGTSSAT